MPIAIYSMLDEEQDGARRLAAEALMELSCRPRINSSVSSCDKSGKSGSGPMKMEEAARYWLMISSTMFGIYLAFV